MNPPEAAANERPVVVLSANSSWNIVNYREGLVRALQEEGYALVVVAPRDLSTDQRIEQLGLDWITINLDRSGLNPFSDLRLFLSYRKILKRISPRAFVSFTIKPNIYGCIAARMQGVPALANVSGLGTVFVKGGPLRRLVIAMYRFALTRAAIVFFQNADDLELFVELDLVRRDQARTIPGSGVDLTRFMPASTPTGAPAILMIARLLRDKGVDEFVEAARRVRANFPEARFQLLGPIDAGNRTSIRPADLERWIADGVIEYLGAAEDVRPFIEAASVVVLPTKYREGVPRSLLEAAAMARPLIATNVPGCRDVVEHGVNGFLCEPGNAPSLATAMEDMLRMPAERRQAMGRASREHVQRRFSERYVIDAYLEALRELG